MSVKGTGTPIVRMKRLKLLIITLVTLIHGTTTQGSAAATDFTDLTAPTYTVKLIQGLPSRGNAVVLRFDVKDNKNEIVRLGGWGAEFSYINNSQIAPACTDDIYRRMEYVSQTFAMPSIKSSTNDGTFERSYYYVFYPGNPKALPSGCPEWRNFNKSGLYITMRIQIADAAGNKKEVDISKLFDDLDLYKNLSPSNLQKSRYCFAMPNDATSRAFYTELTNKYEQKILPYRDLPSIRDKYQDFVAKNPMIESVKSYLDFSQTEFNLEKFLSLPTCSNFFATDREGRQYLQDSPLIYLMDELSKLRNQTEEFASFVAKEISRIDAEVKAKQEAELKAAAELKAKQEADAKAAATKVAPPKKTIITCTKGKLTKKVTAINPKCPSGYKLKK